ncbi:hypothetical protein ACFYZ8_06490 [Streptomyces sp. NPDC001668]|uniref:hypothetical protein n=1 Tax=unclassified Streptomyces TaxID=2593676 RepID=UPI0036A8E567
MHVTGHTSVDGRTGPSAGHHKAADIGEVAQAARVCHHAVSRVIDAHPNVMEESRDALALTGGVTRPVTMHTSDTVLHGCAATLQGLEEAARAAGHVLGVPVVTPEDRLGAAALDHVAAQVPCVVPCTALDHVPAQLPCAALVAWAPSPRPDRHCALPLRLLPRRPAADGTRGRGPGTGRERKRHSPRIRTSPRSSTGAARPAGHRPHPLRRPALPLPHPVAHRPGPHTTFGLPHTQLAIAHRESVPLPPARPTLVLRESAGPRST